MPPPGHLPDVGIEPASPHRQSDSLPRSHLGVYPLLPPLVSAHAAVSGLITVLPTSARSTFYAWDVPATLLPDVKPLGKRPFRKAFPATLRGGWSPWALSHPAPTG